MRRRFSARERGLFLIFTAMIVGGFASSMHGRRCHSHHRDAMQRHLARVCVKAADDARAGSFAIQHEHHRGRFERRVAQLCAEAALENRAVPGQQAFHPPVQIRHHAVHIAPSPAASSANTECPHSRGFSHEPPPSDPSPPQVITR